MGHGQGAKHQPRQGLVLDHDAQATVVVGPVLPARRWLLAFAAAVLLLAAWLGWRYNAPVALELPIVNTGAAPVRLLLHGDGIDRHALVLLAPGDRQVVTLATRHGMLRVQSEGPRARLDAVLIDDVSALRGARVALEVRSASQLVLVPRSD